MKINDVEKIGSNMLNNSKLKDFDIYLSEKSDSDMYRKSLDNSQIKKVVDYYKTHIAGYNTYSPNVSGCIDLIEKGLREGLDVTQYCNLVPNEYEPNKFNFVYN